MPEYFSFEYLEEQMGEPITGIVHIGAHYAEEAQDYHARGIPALWFEGHPDYAKMMQANLAQYPGQEGFEVLLSDVGDETVQFWTTADEFASSIFKPSYHQIQNPHAFINGQIELTTQTFENFWELEAHVQRIDLQDYNVLILDVQGAEEKVYKGMGSYKDHFKGIISEYSTVEFYEGGPRIENLNETFVGYERVFPDELAIHGDGLWIRRD